MNNKIKELADLFATLAIKTADAGDGDTLYLLEYSRLAEIQEALDKADCPVVSRSNAGETEGELRKIDGDNRIYLYYNARSEALCAVLGNGALEDDSETGAFIYPDTVLYQVENNILKNSMTYLIRLRDGSFIIFDGGIEATADDIARIMDELAPSEASHRIRAWIITHSHYDHTTLFNSSALRLKPERVYINFPTPEETVKRDERSANENRKVRATLEALKQSSCKIYKPYAGQSFFIGELRFDVLFSQAEWTLSEGMTTVNDASLVLKLFSPNGKSVLFLADVMSEGGRTLEALYSSETLKSDIVQVAHHSMYGPDYSIYEKIAPAACLWPVSASEYDLYGKSIPRNNRLLELNIPHYFSHNGIAKITL